MPNNICLVGNPNCGKTTLFNRLTGKNEKVGNRAGVSVESKVGRCIKDKSVTITDLPGAYSLKSASEDERVVTDYLAQYDGAIVSVVDGMNLERSLNLTAELTRFNAPMVIAVNFCDEMAKRGVKIDLSAIESAFGVSVVLISARKNIGIPLHLHPCRCQHPLVCFCNDSRCDLRNTFFYLHCFSRCLPCDG